MSRSRASACRLRLVAPLGLALLVMLVAGWSATSRGGPSILLYSGLPSQATSPLVSAFKKQTGISVNVRTNDSIVLANETLQEGSHSPADAFLSEDSPELMTLEEHGLLVRLPASILGQVPAQIDSPSGAWVGVGLSVSALDYDPDQIARKSLPKSILDLAQPRWKGKFEIAPTDPDFAALVGAVISAYGTKTATAWLEGVKRNAQTAINELTVAYNILSGGAALGVVNQTYIYQARYVYGAQSLPYYFPAGNVGSFASISGAAVLASSKHQADAERFLAFVVSKQGQTILARSNVFIYPARPGVKPNHALPPLSSIPHAALSPSAVGNDEQVAKLFQQIGFY